MAESYNYGINILRDYLLELLLQNNDISEKKYKAEIEQDILLILYQLGVEENDLSFLEFEIKKHKNIGFIIEPDNIVCALWFIGILPHDCDQVYTNKYAIVDDRKYIFNEKTKKLTWKKKKV